MCLGVCLGGVWDCLGADRGLFGGWLGGVWGIVWCLIWVLSVVIWGLFGDCLGSCVGGVCGLFGELGGVVRGLFESCTVREITCGLCGGLFGRCLETVWGLLGELFGVCSGVDWGLFRGGVVGGRAAWLLQNSSLTLLAGGASPIATVVVEICPHRGVQRADSVQVPEACGRHDEGTTRRVCLRGWWGTIGGGSWGTIGGGSWGT